MKLFAIMLCLSMGCATQFTGDPHVDPATCQAKCSASQLQFVGMVYMGEYSSACICDLPRPASAPSLPAAPAAPPAPSVTPAASAAAAGAAAGVVMQMRRASNNQQQP